MNREVRLQPHQPACVLGSVLCAGVGADSQWECWRAEEDEWNPSGARMTEELTVRKRTNNINNTFLTSSHRIQ